MKSRKQTKLLRGQTQARHKRPVTHQSLLDAVEATERACIEAIAVAKALDRLSADAAMAAQRAHWELSEARKRFAAHKHEMDNRKRPTAELTRMVAAAKQVGLIDELKRAATPSENALINELQKSTAKAGAAVDKALAFVKQSTKRIAKMERRKR